MFTASELIYHPTIPIIDAQDAAEVVRWRLIGDLVAPLIDTIVPEDDGQARTGLPPARDCSQVRHVLDLGCGQGEWALSLAYAHPELEVAGVEAHRALVDAANRTACDQRLTNASFGLVDFTRLPFDFSDASFDLITATFLCRHLEEPQWPALVLECARLLKPGGWLRLIECEAGMSSSPALEQLSLHYDQALKRAGLHPIPPGRAHDLRADSALRRMLGEAGLPVCATSRATLDFSASQIETYAAMRQVLTVFCELVQPFVLRIGVVNEAEYASLVEQVTWEIRSPCFADAGTCSRCGGKGPGWWNRWSEPSPPREMCKETPMWTTPPTDALSRVDQCIEEAHESLAQLSDALLYLYGCAPSDELPGGRLSPETELVLLAEQRRCQLARAHIKRLEARVRPHLAGLRQSQVVGVAPAGPVAL